MTASDLMVDVCEDKGKLARAVIGANTLPLDAAVELETIVEVLILYLKLFLAFQILRIFYN